jgi:hypothetical protein
MEEKQFPGRFPSPREEAAGKLFASFAISVIQRVVAAEMSSAGWEIGGGRRMGEREREWERRAGL